MHVDGDLCGKDIIVFQTGEVLFALVGAVVSGKEVVPGVAWVKHQIIEGNCEADGGGHGGYLLGEDGQWGRTRDDV